MASWAGRQATDEVTPDPKPPPRLKASEGEWRRIRERFADSCCVSCGLVADHLHHVAFKRADRGDDIEENLCPICVSCHGRFHSHGEGWERIAGHIRAYVMGRQSRLSYVLAKMGQELFERRYPCPPWLAIGDLDRYRRPDLWLRESEAVEGYEKEDR